MTKNQDGSVTIKDTWAFDGDDGTDMIDGVEWFHFKDGMISLAGLQALQDGPISLQVAPPVVPPAQPVTPPPVVKNISGSSASEAIYGDSLADVLKGNGGNDRVYGLDGADGLMEAPGMINFSVGREGTSSSSIPSRQKRQPGTRSPTSVSRTTSSG